LPVTFSMPEKVRGIAFPEASAAYLFPDISTRTQKMEGPGPAGSFQSSFFMFPQGSFGSPGTI
jgi:hypothetical protein